MEQSSKFPLPEPFPIDILEDNEDPLNPARGIIIAFCFGSVVWAAVIMAWWLL